VLGSCSRSVLGSRFRFGAFGANRELRTPELRTQQRTRTRTEKGEPRSVNDTRKYPDRPYVGVGAVIVAEGKVLLVKRKYDPLAGRWSLPGGGVEVGETLEESVAREMREETGLDIEVGPVIEVFDRILRDEDGRVRYHFVLVDYLCWPAGGTLQAGSDVADAVFVDPEGLISYELTAKATAVIERALELDRTNPRTLRAMPDDPNGPNDPNAPNVMRFE
jgi:ADP-ribose pyrophosphatase YjhB (NUDIX family)